MKYLEAAIDGFEYWNPSVESRTVKIDVLDVGDSSVVAFNVFEVETVAKKSLTPSLPSSKIFTCISLLVSLVPKNPSPLIVKLLPPLPRPNKGEIVFIDTC